MNELVAGLSPEEQTLLLFLPVAVLLGCLLYEVLESWALWRRRR